MTFNTVRCQFLKMFILYNTMTKFCRQLKGHYLVLSR